MGMRIHGLSQHHQKESVDVDFLETFINDSELQ